MDIRKVKKLIELLEESNINEIEIKEGEESVRISRGQNVVPQMMAAPMAAPVAAPSSSTCCSCSSTVALILTLFFRQWLVPSTAHHHQVHLSSLK